MKRALAALAGVLCASSLATATAVASHTLTDVVSTGPNGGNGSGAAVYRGASADGTRVFFQTSESLVSTDTDAAIDVYERSNGTTTLVTTGPSGGNGANSATFTAASQDGSRVSFRTAERLVSADTDGVVDIYERSNGATMLVSTGPAGGNGTFTAVFDGISQNGSRVFFHTAESLVGSDTDTDADVYERSGGTTSLLSAGPIGGSGPFVASFAGATPDGSKVYFHADEPLVGSDVDTSQDVYERAAGVTSHLSIGPAGGNGNDDFDYDAFFEGVSADGARVWLHTDETLVFGDTDTVDDIYEHAGGGITLLSIGPAGGNADIPAFFDQASDDGSKVFFDTQESLVASDTDSAYDIYERSGGATTLISAGPVGGNGAYYTMFGGISSDGSRVFFQTPESLVGSDTDTFQDIYERSGTTTTLLSTGPDGGNGSFPSNFSAVSRDGSRVFFSTDEPLALTDADLFPDLYEAAGGVTTRISTGAAGGVGDFYAFFAGMAQDGSRVFFETDEILLGTDLDAVQDVYQAAAITGYPRPKGATPLYAPLVLAFSQCTESNRVHAAPLAYPACSPAVPRSSQLTIGSPDANGKAANFVGSVRISAIAGVASTPADEADVEFTVSVADVRKKSDLSDYSGELLVNPALRVTDKVSGSIPLDPATVQDLAFGVPVPCTTTADATTGSTCATTTTADAVLPGTVRELKRTVWQLGQVQVLDGGPDGLAATPAGNTLFAVQGFFAP